MTRLAELEPLLLPAPRRLERSEGRIAASDPTVQHSTEHGPEGYRLVVGCEQQGVRIETKTPAGEQRARATLSQLERQYGAHIPRLVIDDWPTIERRGVSLDVSRDRVPTRARLDRLVDAAAGWKLNEVELYTEHTFAYAAHEAVWKDASPITPDELREFDRRACALGVRWIANQNCFGHFERWLKHPAYADLAETHGAFEFEGIQLQGPFSLNPTDPRALELVRALLDELLPCVTGGAVHLGCDETQDIGQGASAAAVKESGAFAVWSEYVGALATHVNDAGHEPRIWADIALRWPERLAEQHPALVPIAWGYEPDHPFRAQASSLAASGRPFHLACGTSTWRGFTGRTTERRGALSACVDAAREHGARGVMCTEWGDVGHRQVPVLGEFAWAEFAARRLGRPRPGPQGRLRYPARRQPDTATERQRAVRGAPPLGLPLLPPRRDRSLARRTRAAGGPGTQTTTRIARDHAPAPARCQSVPPGLARGPRATQSRSVAPLARDH
ncbi:MAG: family 20 glycosylhydrolase [Planctomycetota bacterium]|jgi:hypothetical protein